MQLLFNKICERQTSTDIFLFGRPSSLNSDICTSEWARVFGAGRWVNTTEFLGFSHHSRNKLLAWPHSISDILTITSLLRLGCVIRFTSLSEQHNLMYLKSNGLLRPVSNDCTILSHIHSTWDLAKSITLMETLLSKAIE